MVKIINRRNEGHLFHYAHFIFDCLFVEVINNIYKHKYVFRQKIVGQTLGNFAKIYEEVMQNKSIEFKKNIFNKIPQIIKILPKKEVYNQPIYFYKFRKYIFKRYNINPLLYDSTYPEFLLIERGGRIKLIDDEELNKNNKNVTTGKERREINDIDKLHTFLENNYSNKYKKLMLEGVSFYEQIKYYNNAKIIICAHGASMSNMLFCKQGTIILEVTCDMTWEFFDITSTILKLIHVKCNDNNIDKIIEIFNENIKNYNII